ncbi:MAG: Ger(x)C family spore germination protein [Bacillota bacterium]|nr:Ger(x)C family spore germination protein [Bacillota bacterium]
MKKKIKSKIIFFNIIVFIFSALFCSCKREISILPSAVMGTAIDKLPGDEPISITLEVVNTKTADESEESSGKPGGSVYEESKGKSLYEAIENLAEISPAKTDFSHNGIVILSKELCESGISDVLDYLFRGREFRSSNWLLVAEDSAKEIIESSSPNEDITSIGLNNLMLQLEKNNTIVPVDLNYYAARANRVSMSSYIPVASIDKSKGSSSGTIKINKMAIFKKNKLAGILSVGDTKTLMWLSGNRAGHMVVYPLENEKNNKNMSVDVIKKSVKIIPNVKNGRIKFEINCSGYGTIREIGNMYLDPETIKKIEGNTEQALKEKLDSLIYKSQKTLNVDFLGFSEKIYNNNPKFWFSIKNNWDSIYPNADYEVNFDVKITSTGIIKDKQ